MYIVLEVTTYIVAFTVAIILFMFAIYILHHFVWFYWRTCKYCGHTMDFKGLKEDSDNSHYSFQCPHCGAWEEIPKEDFDKAMNEDFNPNKEQL